MNEINKVIQLPKWADYLIDCVKYDREGKHIVKVGVLEGVGIDNVPKRTDPMTRNQVINLMERRVDKKSFITIYKNKQTGKWKKGSSLEIVEINRNKFIKTEKNDKEADNLGELPLCKSHWAHHYPLWHPYFIKVIHKNRAWAESCEQLFVDTAKEGTV